MAFPSEGRMLLIACVVAGGLAVPLHPIATPVAAAVGGILGLLGLRVWHWSGLPRLLTSQGSRGASRLMALALWWSVGLVLGLVLLLVLRTVIEPRVPSIGARIAAAGELPVWRRALIIYVAAVGEEVVFRLLLLSLIAGLIAQIIKAWGGATSARAIWCANVLAALLFASAHLPPWAGTGHLGIGLVLSVIALNAAAGLVLGYAFVTRGIVVAMWAHAGGDCAIQLLGPLIK